MLSAVITFAQLESNQIMNAAAETWSTVRDAAPGLVLALMAYATFWLRSHIGKSNGHGPLNKQATEMHEKIEVMLQRLDELLPPEQPDNKDDENDGDV